MVSDNTTLPVRLLPMGAAREIVISTRAQAHMSAHRVGYAQAEAIQRHLWNGLSREWHELYRVRTSMNHTYQQILNRTQALGRPGLPDILMTPLASQEGAPPGVASVRGPTPGTVGTQTSGPSRGQNVPQAQVGQGSVAVTNMMNRQGGPQVHPQYAARIPGNEALRGTEPNLPHMPAAAFAPVPAPAAQNALNPSSGVARQKLLPRQQSGQIAALGPASMNLAAQGGSGRFENPFARYAGAPTHGQVSRPTTQARSQGPTVQAGQQTSESKARPQAQLSQHEPQLNATQRQAFSTATPDAARRLLVQYSSDSESEEDYALRPGNTPGPNNGPMPSNEALSPRMQGKKGRKKRLKGDVSPTDLGRGRKPRKLKELEPFSPVWRRPTAGAPTRSQSCPPTVLKPTNDYYFHARNHNLPVPPVEEGRGRGDHHHLHLDREHLLILNNWHAIAGELMRTRPFGHVLDWILSDMNNDRGRKQDWRDPIRVWHGRFHLVGYTHVSTQPPDASASTAALVTSNGTTTTIPGVQEQVMGAAAATNRPRNTDGTREPALRDMNLEENYDEESEEEEL